MIGVVLVSCLCWQGERKRGSCKQAASKQVAQAIAPRFGLGVPEAKARVGLGIHKIYIFTLE